MMELCNRLFLVAYCTFPIDPGGGGELRLFQPSLLSAVDMVMKKPLRKAVISARSGLILIIIPDMFL